MGIIELLDKLQVLDIRNNQITELPCELSKMKNLRIVKIAGNPIEGIPFGSEYIDFDLNLPIATESDNRSFDRTRKSPPGGKFLHKTCTWCDVAGGYRK